MVVAVALTGCHSGTANDLACSTVARGSAGDRRSHETTVEDETGTAGPVYIVIQRLPEGEDALCGQVACLIEGDGLRAVLEGGLNLSAGVGIAGAIWGAHTSQRGIEEGLIRSSKLRVISCCSRVFANG
jgi:hypothetical protein